MAASARAPYALDNNESTAGNMHNLLSAILDEFTEQRLCDAGLREADICWEIGAGNGSVARWMAQKVGDGGLVFTTDINPCHILAHPRMRVLTHDVTTDAPPAESFDVIHARLVFAHLPSRRQTLDKVARTLRPGGAVVIEEWGQWTGPLLTSPIRGAAAVYGRYQAALLAVFRAAGNDPAWATQAADAMTQMGLVDVDVRTEAGSWLGGTPGCMLPVVVSTQLRDQLLGAGAKAADLDALPEIMTHPETVVHGNLTVSTIGHRASQT